MADVYLWRQVFVLSTGLFFSGSVGMMLSFPSVLGPALLAQNTTDILASSAQVSLIAASNGFAGMLGFFTLSPIMQISGRKAVYVCCNLFLLIGWIILSLAHDITSLFVGRVVHGFAIGGIYINGMIVSEYSASHRRGYFTTLKKASIAVGILGCHALSLIWDWRQIANFAVIMPTISIVMTLFWPESPSYLAMKGRFKDSEKSFIWLHGTSKMHELNTMLSTQSQKLKNPSTEKWYEFLLRKDFLRPFMIVSLLTLLLDLCGKYYFVVYVIQIMVELTGDNSIAVYCSLGADFLSIIGLIFSCFVISFLKRRTVLFAFGLITVTLMLLISAVTVLKLSITVWLTPALIILQNFIVNVALIPVSFTLIGEVVPIEYKGCGSCLNGVVFTLLYTFMLKLTPVLMENTGVEGVYAIYGLSIAVCLGLLYFVVPETKDKTLQDIENEFKDIQLKSCDETVTDNLLGNFNHKIKVFRHAA